MYAPLFNEITYDRKGSTTDQSLNIAPLRAYLTTVGPGSVKTKFIF